jgi:hypothetical protein
VTAPAASAVAVSVAVPARVAAVSPVVAVVPARVAVSATWVMADDRRAPAAAALDAAAQRGGGDDDREDEDEDAKEPQRKCSRHTLHTSTDTRRFSGAFPDAPRPSISAHLADDLVHDLARPAPDRVQARVAEQALYDDLAHEAVAAVDLHRLIDHE